MPYSPFFGSALPTQPFPPWATQLLSLASCFTFLCLLPYEFYHHSQPSSRPKRPPFILTSYKSLFMWAHSTSLSTRLHVSCPSTHPLTSEQILGGYSLFFLCPASQHNPRVLEAINVATSFSMNGNECQEGCPPWA